jgi:cardiolipin synthase
LLVGGSRLLKEYNIRVPVIYAGKFATTFLFVGLAGLMLNFPQVPGLGICDVSWLPGFNTVSCSWGIWLVYIGLCLGVYTTIYYVVQANKALKKAKRDNADG